MLAFRAMFIRMAAVVLCVICLSNSVYGAVTYKVRGTCKYVDRTYTGVHTASASSVPVPEGIIIEIRGEESLAPDPVLATVRVGANGQYEAEWTEDDTTAPNLYLKVFLQTKKADGTQKIFMSGHNDGDYVHHFWTSKTFLANFRQASVAHGHTYGLIVNLEFGANGGSDSFNATGKNAESANPADWPVADLVTIEGDRDLSNGGYSSEERYRDLAANLRVLDMAYDQVEAALVAAGKGSIMHRQQEVEVPGMVAWGLANPVSWSIHLGWDVVDTFIPIHEFGHIVMYMSIGAADGLVWEIFGHFYFKETNLSIAFYEGWADFFAVSFAETTPSEYSGNPGYWVSTPGAYWKGEDNDGKDNSGEIVEGAVSRVFYDTTSSATTFAGRLEPVWKIWRDNTSPVINDFEDFYDQFLVSNSGASGASARQDFRDLCAVNGIVYSRAKMTRIASVAGQDNFVDASDKLWVSAEGKIKAERMSASNLKVSAVDEPTEKIGFEVWTTAGQATPITWSGISDANLITSSNWTAFASDTSADGFYGVLNAGVTNKYYPVRVRVLEDCTANTTTEDRCQAPVLGTNTATWWYELGMMYQIKVDKEKPTVKERKPAAN